MVYVAFILVEPSRKRRVSRTPLWDMFKIAGKALANRHILWLMLVMAAMFSTGVIGLGVGWLGFLSAAFGICAGLGAKYSHVLIRELGERWSLAGLLIPGPGMILLGSIPSISMIPVIFLIGFVWGFSIPMLLRFLNDLVDSETRATVIAVSNMISTVFLAILSPIFRRIIVKHSLGTGYIILGAWFLLLTSFSLLQLIKARSDTTSQRAAV
jgi:MFS family permease